MRKSFSEIRWSDTKQNPDFFIACWSLDLFSSFFKKYNENSFHIYLPKVTSSLQFFQQFAVSENRADFCKVPNCQYPLLIHDESIDLSSSNIDRNCISWYQRVDWLFTTFKHYFPCIKQIQVFVFQKFLSAIDFHRSFKYLVLTNLKFTKKRLLRKNFRTKRNSGRQSEPSFSRSEPTANLLLKFSSVVKSEKRQKFLQTISVSNSSFQ